MTRFFFLLCLFLSFTIWGAASEFEDIKWSHLTRSVTIPHIPELEGTFPHRSGERGDDITDLNAQKEKAIAAVKNWAARVLSAQVKDLTVKMCLRKAKSTLGIFRITHRANKYVVKAIYGKDSQQHIAHCIDVDQEFVRVAAGAADPQGPENFRLIELVDYGYAHSEEGSEKNVEQKLYFTLYQRAQGQDFFQLLPEYPEPLPLFQKLGWSLGKWVSENTVKSDVKDPNRWRCITHGDFCTMNLFWDGEFFTLIDLEGIYDNAFPPTGNITDDATYFFTVTAFFLKAIMEDTFNEKTAPLLIAFAEYFGGSMSHYFAENGMATQNLRGYILNMFMDECKGFNNYLDDASETHRLFPPKVDIPEDNRETLRERSLKLMKVLKALMTEAPVSNPYAL